MIIPLAAQCSWSVLCIIRQRVPRTQKIERLCQNIAFYFLLAATDFCFGSVSLPGLCIIIISHCLQADSLRSPFIRFCISKQAWCLTSTETIRLIRDGERRGEGGSMEKREFGNFVCVNAACVQCILNYHRSTVMTALFVCDMDGATWNCCTTLECHFIPSHLHIVCMYNHHTRELINVRNL